MTTHTSCYELTSARTTAGASMRPDAAKMRPPSSVIGDEVSSQAPLPIVSPIPWSGYTPFKPTRFMRAQPVTEDPSDLMMLEANPAATSVQVNGVLTDNVVQIFQTSHTANAAFIARGRMTPGLRVVTGGAVQTAVNALTGSVDSWTIQTIDAYSDQNGYTGLAHFCDFESSPPATGGTSSNAQTLINKLSDSGYKTSLGSVSGSPVYANSCALAGIAPEGAVYIRPEDIGVSDGQITQAVGSNTADRFRFHPSVFVRRGNYWNSLMRRAFDTVDIAQTQDGQPLRIVTVNADPISSNWLLQIDGQMVLATIQHPEGSDLRRPRDIWNEVLVPAIEGSSDARDALTIGIPGSSQAAVGVLARLAYVEYARCLPLAGGEVVQDDTSPPA